MLIKLNATLLFLFFTSLCHCQSRIIQGYVYDKSDNQPLIGALVLNSDGKGVSTNEIGFFQLVRTSGNIKISYFGYQTEYVEVGEKDTIYTVYLGPTVLDAVEIIAQRALSEQFGRTTIDAADIKMGTYLLGEKDLFKRIAMMPGISQANELNSNIIVRGGNFDQNITKLDGANLYNTNHLFGFIAPINPYALRSLDVYKGSFPSNFGGRLSSIIDIFMDGGSKTERENIVNIGLLNSSVKSSGPILKDKISYNVSSRVSYPLALAALVPSETDKIVYYVYDYSGKLDWKINENQKISILYYHNSDIFKAQYVSLNDTKEKLNIKWGNTALSTNYFKSLSNKSFINITAAYSKYNYNQNSSQLYNNKLEFNVESKVSTEELQTDLKYNSIIFGKIKYFAGLNFSFTNLNGNQFSISGPAVDPSSISNIDTFFTIEPYIQFNIPIGDRLNIDIGSRVNYLIFFNTKSYLKLQPRFKLNFAVNENIQANFSYSRMLQPIQQLSLGSTVIPNELWTFPIQGNSLAVSDQLSLGYSQTFKKFEFMAEAYYKHQDNLIQSIPNNLILNPSIARESFADRGKGNMYGVELYLRKRLDRFTGSLGYTLSKSTRNFADLNNGKTFAFRFDRRHDMEGILEVKLSKRWSVGSNFAFTSGQRFTIPTSIALLPGSITSIEIASQLYNTSLPFYKRVDLMFNKRIETKTKVKTLSFGIYNVFGFINPNYIDIKKKFNYDPINPSITNSVKQYALLRWVPFINYEIKL